MTSKRQPEIFSPTEIHRSEVPECLCVVVDNVAFATISHENGLVVTPPPEDFRAKLCFSCEDLTKSNLQTHLIHSNCSILSTNFISVFEDEDIALEAHPFCTSGLARHEQTIPYVTKLVVDTSKLQAGWVDTPSGKSQSGSNMATCPWCPKVVLHNYQRRSDMTHKVPNRSGSISSIRSISFKEQEKHLKEQVLRNKASRDSLRAKAASKKREHDRGRPLLRQALRNKQALQEDEGSQNIKNPLGAQVSDLPRQRDTFPSPPVQASVKVVKGSSLYATVRSPKLREALERTQASKSSGALQTKGYATMQGPQELMNSGMESSSSHMSESLNGGSAGQGPSNPDRDPKRLTVMVHLYEQQFQQSSDTMADLKNLEITASVVENLHEDSDSLSRSERLRRAREGKKKADSIEPDHTFTSNADAKVKVVKKLGPEAEVEDISNTAFDTSGVEWVLHELTQPELKLKLTLLELAISSEAESKSNGALAMRDEDRPSEEAASIYEADISDTQSSASERAFGSRRRRWSPHSRLTTPTGMYATRPRRPTIG